jgi:hypothetical protein
MGCLQSPSTSMSTAPSRCPTRRVWALGWMKTSFLGTVRNTLKSLPVVLRSRRSGKRDCSPPCDWPASANVDGFQRSISAGQGEPMQQSGKLRGITKLVYGVGDMGDAMGLRRCHRGRHRLFGQLGLSLGHGARDPFRPGPAALDLVPNHARESRRDADTTCRGRFPRRGCCMIGAHNVKPNGGTHGTQNDDIRGKGSREHRCYP